MIEDQRSYHRRYIVPYFVCAQVLAIVMLERGSFDSSTIRSSVANFRRFETN